MEQINKNDTGASDYTHMLEIFISGIDVSAIGLGFLRGSLRFSSYRLWNSAADLVEFGFLRFEIGKCGSDPVLAFVWRNCRFLDLKSTFSLTDWVFMKGLLWVFMILLRIPVHHSELEI
ncbi:hypothetical protein MRB53_028821 [Persea americana]|uniref:Uncharacterized protein n=1 Tax=Persea americana TaxID=3435 RepID=A0ACC2KGK1_PERAE|nr:hypothetical protein MRB53_028821 [Persea americana]